MANAAPVTLWCDEAGSNGPEMLHEPEPYFVYASHDLSETEAAEIARAIRARPKFQSAELKARTLRGRADWPEIALEVTRALEGRAIAIVTDKRLNLAGRSIEHLVMPALAGAHQIFHDHDVFRIAMRLLDPELRTHPELSRQINDFMKRFDLSKAPAVFDAEPPRACGAILRATLQIARANRDAVDAAVAQYRSDVDPAGIWTIDLALPSLYAMLFDGWGQRHPSVDVVCDESKPLLALGSKFAHRIGRRGAWQFEIGRGEAHFEGGLAGPIRFEDSKRFDALQISDLLAGVVLDAARGAFGPAYSELYAWTRRHKHHCSLVHYPEFRHSTQLARVSAAIMRELGARAAVGRPLRDGLEALFDAQRRRYVKPSARVGNPQPRSGRAPAPCPI